jgi:hypothetical protein
MTLPFLLKSHEEKVRWVFDNLHDPGVECLVICGDSCTENINVINQVLLKCRTCNSIRNEVLLWKHGEIPTRVPLTGTGSAGCDYDEDDMGRVRCPSGMLVLRLAIDGITQELKKDLGDRCRIAEWTNLHVSPSC